MAVFGKLAGALDGGALLDVLQNLRIARFIADDEQPASRFLHRLKRFIIGGHARCAGPCQSQRLQFRAQFDGARLLDVESVVVEEKFLHVRPMFFRLAISRSNVVARALPPWMSAERLRPQAEGALRGTSAGRVQRDVRMEQERNVVTAYVQVALVNVSHVRQSVEILGSADGRDCGRPRRSCVRHAQDFSSGLPLAYSTTAWSNSLRAMKSMAGILSTPSQAGRLRAARRNRS